MRKYLAVAAVSLVAISACTTKKDDAADSTPPAESTAGTTADSAATDSRPAATEPANTTPATDATVPDTEAPASTVASVVDDRAPGVTDDTIKIGIVYPDLSSLKAVLGTDHGDYAAAYQAEIDKINAAGGINGRTLEPVIVGVNPNGTDGAAAACTQLTQDEQVFVAVGFFDADEVLCFIDTNETPTIGGTMTAERQSKARVAWYTTDPGEDQATAGITGLAESGALGDSVAVVGLAGDEATYDESIRPILEANGIDPVDVAYIDTSVGDIPAIYSNAATISERFKADGVEQVLLVGSGAGAFFPAGLAQTDFRPQLLFSDASSANTFGKGEGNDLSVLEGAISAGPYDNSNSFLTLGSPTSDCVENQAAAGITMKPQNELADGEPKLYVSSLIACRNVTLAAAMLEAAGPDLNFGTFTTAGNSLGDIMLPGFPDPWHFGAPPSADGDPKIYIYAWDPATGTFTVQDD